MERLYIKNHINFNKSYGYSIIKTNYRKFETMIYQENLGDAFHVQEFV